MYEILKEKYEKNFIRKNQLFRYVLLKKITEEEYKKIIQNIKE